MTMGDDNNTPPPDRRRVRNAHTATVEGIEPGQEGELDANNPGVRAALDAGLLRLTQGTWTPQNRPPRPADPFGPPPIITSPENTPEGRVAIPAEGVNAPVPTIGAEGAEGGEPHHDRRSKRPPRE